ncbi:hypothetical protein EGW08_007805, partial [Elysia chlorotica]
VDFGIQRVQTSSRRSVKVQLWDIAGQERFACLTRAYYRDAAGCVLMFDLGRPHSLDSARRWKTDLDSKARTQTGALLPCILVANKCDRSPVSVSDSDIQSLCQEMLFLGWTKTLAKDGTMVPQAVGYLLDKIVGVQPRSPSILSNSISLSTEGAGGGKKQSCPC